MPAELKRRLADEVASRGSNLNDVAVEILAARYGVPYEPTGRRGAPRGEGREVLLRMPRALKERLAKEKNLDKVDEALLDEAKKGAGGPSIIS